MRIRDPGSSQPWIRDGKNWIGDPWSGFRYKHSRSTTLYECYRYILAVLRIHFHQIRIQASWWMRIRTLLQNLRTVSVTDTNTKKLWIPECLSSLPNHKRQLRWSEIFSLYLIFSEVLQTRIVSTSLELSMKKEQASQLEMPCKYRTK